jgi:hypothetical protein
VTEAIDDRVGIMVSAAAVPTIEAGIRTKLHHTKREYSTGIGMAMTTGTNKRIYPGGNIVLGKNVERAVNAEQQEYDP